MTQLPARLSNAIFRILVSTLVFGNIAVDSLAGDWPQILGPNRDGHAVDEDIADDWDSVEPKAIWALAVGDGYAGPIVVGDFVYLFHREGKNEVLSCIAARQGILNSSVAWPARYRGGIDADLGPRCVPLFHKDKIIVFGAAGEIHCAKTNCEKVWSRKLGSDLKALDGFFGFGSSPIVVDDLVIVNVGGKPDASIVAMDLESGEIRWTQFNDAASYAAPMLLNPKESDPLALFVTRMNMVGVRPRDGETLFTYPFGARGPTVNAATPVSIGDEKVFLTASYGIGGKAISIKDAKPKVLWESDESLSSQYPTPIFHDGFLYGVHGREDGGAASLRCVRATDGKVQWQEPDVGMAHLMLVDGKFVMQTVEGELVLFDADSDAYSERGRKKVSKQIARALPAFSKGVHYVKSTDGKLTAWRLP